MVKSQISVLKKILKEEKNVTILLFFISIVVLSAFYPSLKNGFVNWDDPKFVSENLMIQDLSFQNIKKIFTSFHMNNYHPLSIFSYAIEYYFFGLNPFYYHFTNLILHIINTLLVFWMIYLLSDKVLVSFIVSILFGIHPLHVESVVWISERRDVLYSFFFLLSIISFFYYKKIKKKKYYYFSLFLFVLSCLSKAMAITLPLIILLLDYFFYEIDRKKIIEKIPFFIISIIFGIVSFFARSFSKDIQQIYPFSVYFISTCFEIPFYLLKILFPFKLSCVYPYTGEYIKNLHFIFKLIFSFIGIFSLFIIIFIGKYNKKFLFGNLFFLISISPILKIIPSASAMGNSIVYDRYTYIASIGLFYIIGEFSQYLYLKNKKIKVYLLTTISGIILIFSFLTWKYTSIWKDSASLWENVLKNYPDITTAYLQYGAYLYEKGDYDKALLKYNQGIKIDPNNAMFYNNIGNLYFAQKKYDEAMKYYTQAIKINPSYAIAYSNLGATYYSLGKYNDAILTYRKAIKTDPNYANAYFNKGNFYYFKKDYKKAIFNYTLGINITPSAEFLKKRANLYLKLGEFDKALKDCMHLLRIGRKNPEVYNVIGNVFYYKKEYDKSLIYYNKAIKLSPGYLNPYYNIIKIYTKYGDENKLIEVYEKVLKQKQDPEIYNRLGILYTKKQIFDKAIEMFNKAIEIEPLAQYYNNLGIVYMGKGEKEKAIKLWEKALSISPDLKEAKENLQRFKK